MSEISNLHDKYFKEFLDNPQIAVKFLQEILPEELKEITDFSFLRPEKGSFINQELKEAYSDLLFKSRLNKGQEIYIYFLIEHKSYMYELTSFQLLKYMVNIWEREINKEGKKKLTPIIPVVFYHGEEKWKAATEFISLIEGIKDNPELVKYLPNFRHILFELGEKEVIEKVGDTLVRLFFRSLFLKKIIGEEEMNIFIRETLQEIKGLGEEYSYLFNSLALYIIKTVEKLNKEEFFNYAEEILPERRGDIMTIAEQLRQEGKMEGIKEGMERGRKEGMKEGMKEGIAKAAKALNALKKGCSIEEVAELTGLSVEQVEEIRKSLEE